jgi:hypothetical protein
LTARLAGNSAIVLVVPPLFVRPAESSPAGAVFRSPARREPGPLSFVVDTTIVLPNAGDADNSAARHSIRMASEALISVLIFLSPRILRVVWHAAHACSIHARALVLFSRCALNGESKTPQETRHRQRLDFLGRKIDGGNLRPDAASNSSS